LWRPSLTPRIRHLQQQVDLSYTTCQRILKQDLHLHPYRLQLVHELLSIDRPRRQQFCQWFMENGAILEKTFFSDESWFHLSGHVNSQNMSSTVTFTKNWSLGCNK
jgi:hypothetical protein